MSFTPALGSPTRTSSRRLKDDGYIDPLVALAPVYDAGLVGAPRTVLTKPDRLNADEQSVMQTHTTRGRSC